MAILADIYWAGSLLPQIIMILFSQSTAVLRKYSIDQKFFYSLQFLPEVAQNEFSQFREFPEYIRFFQVCVQTGRQTKTVWTHAMKR